MRNNTCKKYLYKVYIIKYMTSYDTYNYKTCYELWFRMFNIFCLVKGVYCFLTETNLGLISSAINVCWNKIKNDAKLLHFFGQLIEITTTDKPAPFRFWIEKVKSLTLELRAWSTSQQFERLPLAPVMGTNHHVAVRRDAQTERLLFVPADLALRSAALTSSSAGVMLLQVTCEGLPAAAYTYHHMTLVQHL